VDSLGDHNPLIKQIRRAVAHGTLTEDGFAVAEGPHLLEEARKARCEIRAVIVSGAAKADIVEGLSRMPQLRELNDKTFRTLCSTETPQGVLALVKPPTADLATILNEDPSQQPALVAILDGVQDPGNAGAIIRVAEAFGATGAIFLKGTVDPFHPRALRGSAGSSFRLPIVRGVELEALQNMQIYAAMAQASTSLEVRAADFGGACAIAIGSEGRGISKKLAARAMAVHIPTHNVESLNAAVAAGILFYEARRQRDEKARGAK
jgi:RNA methyltransferase, TrmH family